MRCMACLAMLLTPVIGWGQLFLIAGTPTPKWNRRFAAALIQVDQNAGVSSVRQLVAKTDGVAWISISYDLRKAVIETRCIVVVDLDKPALAKECRPPDGPGSQIFEWLA